MASSFAARLGQQQLPDLLRDIAFKKSTGILRLSRAKISKSLAFESGNPINAFSSIPSEQIDACLIKEGHTTEGLVAAAKRSHPNPDTLGQTLVEKGIVPADVMNRTASELASRIALSVFEWTDAEYSFEESDPSCSRVMQLSAAELVTEGTRRAASSAAFLELIAPSQLWVVRAETAGPQLADSANLNPTEGYVLSMTDSPTRLSEIATLSGLPEQHIRQAVCVLLALGMLANVDQAPGSKSPLAERAYDEVIEGISTKLRRFKTANYYEILGVDRQSSVTAINRAFHQFEAMFQTHRSDYSDSAAVQHQLDELFSKIRTAHQILSDPIKRREYDRQHGAATTPGLRHPPTSAPTAERGGASAPHRSEMKLPPRKPISIPEIAMRVAPGNDRNHGIERGQQEGSRPPARPPAHAGPQTRPPAVLSPEEVASLKTPANKDAQALRFYRQGRARFDRRELDAAAHLFREAVTLDPSQSHYHMYLGMVLTIQARARREHRHHEGCHVTCHLGGALVSNPKVRYEAEQHFLRAGQIDPANPKIALKLGQLYKEVGLLKKAEIYLNQALTLDPTNKEARNELDTLNESPQEADVQAVAE